MIAKGNNDIYKFIEKIYPICRSITGEGVRETLNEISKIIPLKINEIPTGTKVFDWTVPKEWAIKDAYIKNSHGKKVIDFKKSNLHVVSYSKPVNTKIALKDLKKKLYSLPEHPDWIPYRTTYYKEDWGFCLTHKDLQKLKPDTYEVKIDSKLFNGSLTYGEFYIKGKTKEEILISTHICHPSMCNDNLSGISIATKLGQYLKNNFNHYSYRIIFIPATIGAITWLAINEKNLKNIKYGLVLALLGDKGNFTYKKSRIGNALIDRVMQYALMESKTMSEIREFTPYGYDERQFCSPGINLPVGTIMRTPNKEFPEYHTSADNLEFISSKSLNESYQLVIKAIDIIEKNNFYINLFPKGEPQLGRRGIYNSVAGNIKDIELAMLWVLNYSDGNNDLLDISLKSKISFNIIFKAASILKENHIIKIK